MNKKNLTENQFLFLKNELEYGEKSNILSTENVSQMLNLYQVKQGFNFIRIILVIGSILLGLGILSFIAANWEIMSKLTKLLIIIGIYSGVNIAGYQLQEKYPKTSASFIYLGLLTYGAGIFLVGQIFHLDGHFSNAFLLWALGTLPMVLLLKDKLIFLFVHLLTLVYLNGSFAVEGLPLMMLLLVPGLYYLNYILFNNFSLGTFLNNLVLLNTLVFYLNYYGLPEFYLTAVFFAIGLLLFFYRFKFNQDIFKLQGILITGFSGLILTFKDVWNIIPGDQGKIIASVIFTIVFLIFLLALTKQGNMISLIFICLTIFRFYFDTLYDFMPKSIFFIIGGLILLGFGFYFEKLRKRGVTGE